VNDDDDDAAPAAVDTASPSGVEGGLLNGYTEPSAQLHHPCCCCCCCCWSEDTGADDDEVDTAGCDAAVGSLDVLGVLAA